jgi:hypothetical protein
LRGVDDENLGERSSEDKISAFLPVIGEMVQEGPVTLEAMRVSQYRPDAG